MFNLLFVNTYYVKRIEMATYNALYKSTIIIIIMPVYSVLGYILGNFYP